MERRVVITGFEVICALGNDKFSVKNELMKKSILLSPVEQCKRYAQLSNIKLGKVKNMDSSVDTYDSFDKSEILARKSLNNALKDAGLDINCIDRLDDRVSLSLATSVMGSDYILRFIEQNRKEAKWIVNNKSFAGRLVREYHIKGGCYTTSSACSSGTAAFGAAYDLILDNLADVVICGGTDHITDISLFGFKALDSLSEDVCKPFDKERDGINIGEGSAFFILEEYTHALARNAKIYGEILGYGLSNDAYHITSPDPEGRGAITCMNMALEEAGIDFTKQIYINTHGTGTHANDSMELKSIQSVFKDRDENVFLSSTKSLIGHCLGAAGSIECALALLMMEAGVVPETANSNTNMSENCNYNQKLTKVRDIEYIISNSFAFAGNGATIVIRKLD